MMADYEKRAKEEFPNLTKGLKKVANHLLTDPMVFAIHPVKKVGEIIGVSETMVIRFCHSIGYKGFSSLQQDVRAYLFDPKPATNLASTNTHRFSESIATDIKILNANMDKIEADDLQLVTETLMDSEKAVIVGYYHSFSLAHWFSYNLNYILGNAHLYRPETDVGLLELLPKKSCIFIFSFYRYALDTIRLAKEAKKRDMKIITITDSRVSPVVEFSDIVIPITLTQGNTFSKGPATLSIINAILFEIINKMEEVGELPSTYKYFIKDES